jgi:uncharacterized membrane protein
MSHEPPSRQPPHIDPRERRIVDAILSGTAISRDSRKHFDDARSLGDRVADRLAAFGGSWSFIILCVSALSAWIALNALVLPAGAAPDPYPFILLNLLLSMLAALQAPVILMSQNRQAARDRADAAHDYEVNLKAELEIRHLHEKIDLLRERQWADLVAQQRRQIDMLERLLAARREP